MVYMQHIMNVRESAKDLQHIQFKKSSRCGGGTCVEVAQLPDGTVAVRDAKNVKQALLVFNPAEWTAFVQGVKAGEFDFVDKSKA